MRHPPQLAKPTEVLEWDGGRERRVLDELAVEEPLEIRVGGESVSVTMRTSGQDFELAAGFLFTEGLIKGRHEIGRIAYGCGPDGQPSGNIVDVTLSAGTDADLGRVRRQFFVASSCGICGKASIDAVHARDIQKPNPDFSILPDVLTRLPETLRGGQKVFGRTGGLHAAGLFDAAGAMHAIREDVGRHNAVDKVIGHALLQGQVPLARAVLMISGRGGFEIVQKALVAGIPVVASVSAPSSLAVQLAREYGLTLVGFLRGSRFIVYSAEQRLGRPGEAGGPGGAGGPGMPGAKSGERLHP